jgi:hypothetical protein
VPEPFYSRETKRSLYHPGLCSALLHARTYRLATCGRCRTESLLSRRGVAIASSKTLIAYRETDPMVEGEDLPINEKENPAIPNLFAFDDDWDRWLSTYRDLNDDKPISLF